MPQQRPDTQSPEAWRCLYRNDRVSRVRFVQVVCWCLAMLCVFLLGLAFQDPQMPASERAFVVVTCLLAIVLPNAGMALYLDRYVVGFEISADRARLMTPGQLFGSKTVVLQRSEFLSSRQVNGALETGLTVSVFAPWIWLTTRNARYILDDQCPGADAVVAWATGQGARD